MKVRHCVCLICISVCLNSGNRSFGFADIRLNRHSGRECRVDKNRRIQVSTVRSPWETSQEDRGRTRDAWWTPKGVDVESHPIRKGVDVESDPVRK